MDSYKYKTTPFKHQLNALSRSATKKNFAYFMEMGCVDGETEFLSNRGWVKFKDFELDEWERPLLVAQAVPDPVDDTKYSMQFVEPQAFIKKPAYDWVKVCGAKSSGKQRKYTCEFLFTADHEIPLKPKALKKDNSVLDTRRFDATANYIDKYLNTKEEIEPAISRAYSHIGLSYTHKCTGAMIPAESKYFEPDPDINSLNEWELRFMVAAIADGTFPNKKDNKCDFYFTKERKVERLRMLASRAGIDMAYELYKGRFKDIHILHTIAPMKCKVFDERWYSLPYDKLRTIVNEIFWWDGSIIKSECYFYSTIKESADFIQFALTACGWGSVISYNGPKRLYTVKAPTRTCYDNTLLPYDNMVGERQSTVVSKSIMFRFAERIKEEMMSYCFRVPSGYLVLRRDSRVVIASNSGKTKVMLDNIGMLYKSGHITGALVLAPKGVYGNWAAKEIPTHVPDDIARDVLLWDAKHSNGAKDKLFKQIENWDGKKLQFLVFNIESLLSEKGKKLIVEFIKRHGGNVLALVDESTCIKNHKAKRTKAAIEVGAKCKARRIATGSPVTNSPLDLYSQCAFLDKSLLGCGSYYAFKNTYANIEKVQNRMGQHYEKILSYKNLDHLSELLDKFSFRITKKECLDLPEKIYMTRDVELTPEQLTIYKEMSDYQFALLKQGEEFKEMSAQVILTKFLRLHQILCGSFTDDEGEVHSIPNNRLNALCETIDETSGKIIIWATYLHDIENIEAMLRDKYGDDSVVMYYGKTSSEDRTKAIERFQDPDSPVRFFVGNVQTAGRGITLTAASTVIYYSNNFSLELRQQSEDRAHRLGQQNKVTYVDLVARGSLDEKIIKSLVNKRNIANEILKDDLDSWISLQPA